MNIFHRDIRAAKSPAFEPCRVLLIGALLLAAHLGAAAQQFAFRHYAQDEGLKNLDVFDLIQDKAGFLWSATENGLFRYDGSEFRRYGAADGIQESMVISVLQDVSGRIWAATTDHLYYLSGNHFEAVSNSDPLQIEIGQRVASIDAQHILVISHDTLQLAQPSGPSHQWTLAPYFSASQLASYPELAQLHSVLVDSDHSLWLGCGDHLCQVKSGHIEIYGRQQGIPQPAAWHASFRDSHGTLWIRSPHYISVLLAGASRFITRNIVPESQALFYGPGKLTFDEDPDGNILTEATTGIARWNGSQWQIFDASNGIASNDISTILTDHQGSIWFSTRGHGINRWLGYGQIQSWTVNQGLRNEVVWTIFRDSRRRLWFGDQLSFDMLAPDTNRIQVAPGFTSTPFQGTDGFTESSDGAIWATSLPGYVVRAAPGRRFVRVARLPLITRVFKDSSNRIWFCTHDGLYIARNPTANVTIDKFDAPPDSFTDAAQDAHGNLWFVSNHHLYRLTGNTFTQIPLAPSMTRGDIRSLAVAPDGTLWVGGGLSHLFHLKVEGNKAQILDSLAPPQIVSTDIEFVRFDKRGWLWVGTDLGVNVFNGTHWKLLTQRDGLISNDTDEGAFFVDSDDSVWIGVNGGATHLLHPDRLFSNAPLHIMLTSATLGDHTLSLEGGRNVWRWHGSPLDINFTSLNFEREDSIHFRYRLIGLEHAWSQTTERTLHYAAVPPGNYRFEVQALDPNQHNASAIVSLSFIVRPPWWRTTLFYLVLAFLALVFSFLIWRWRERRLLREQQSLKQLIAQRTSELEAEKIELVAAREALLHQASHDALTGLWNRSAILEILEREMNRAHREHTKLAVVLADLDHFKQINDTHGHLAGDSILRDAALRMFENIRPYDFIGRYGGEEFLIVLPGLSTEEPFSRLTQLHQAMSEKPFFCDGKSFHVTSSFGGCGIHDSMMAVEDMVRCADEALYRAKASGRDCIIFHTHPIHTDPVPEIS
jgi:diguanylate cyclase (GGDEF)-like protein